MAVIQRYRNVIFITVFLLILLILWPIFIRDKFLSFSTQTIEVEDLETFQQLHLKKYPKQGFIHGIELEISGTSDRTLMLLMGDSDSVLNQQILLKKGKIDFAYTGDWYTDDCYILLPSEPGADIKLSVDYRFLSTH